MNPLWEKFTRFCKETRQAFNIIQKKGPLTKNDLLIPFQTNLSTLNRIIEPLEKERLIVEAGIGESSGGRKPVLYDLNPKRFYILGLDISRPYTQMVLTNPKMDILYRDFFTMDETLTPQNTVGRIAELLTEALERLQIAPDLLLGIGLGTVGPMDRERGVLINPKNFAAPGWIGIPIKKLLQDQFELPVFVDNGANTAVLMESLYGQGRLFPNISYFNCSIGIRTGATSDGTIVRTIDNAEDAFGHMVIDVKGESCDCGNHGCIECYSSIHAILRNYHTAVKIGRTSKIEKPLADIDYMDICAAAEEGDDLSREVICNAAAFFGVGLTNYINLFNPGLVILSGPLVSHSNLFYQMSTETAMKRIYSKEANRIIFSKGGQFGDDAISLGAAAMVIEEALR